MADSSNCSERWIKKFILYVIAVSGVVASFSCAQCVDGTYKHEGRDCCLCPAGQYLVNHCTKNLQYGECELCKVETYSSEPTYQTSCEPCTSCLHPNDHLEEEEPCTSATNRKCRCQQDHYCSSRTEICILCHPCTKCDHDNIKIPCTANNDTVCNDKTTDGNTTAIVVGVAVFGGVVVLAIILLVCWQRKKKQQSIPITNVNDEAMQPFIEVELHPYLPDIVEIIGLRDMQDIAMSTNISSVTLESVRLDNPGDSREQTLQLLKVFIEKHSIDASRLLFENLRRKGKNAKADRVQHLIARPAGVAESV